MATAAALCVGVIPAGAANPTGPSHFNFVYKGAGTAQIAQYIDHTRPDTKPNWDVYYKHVNWTITWHVTIEGGAITQLTKPDAQVAGTGRALVRSNPSSSCSGPVKLLNIGTPSAPYTPIDLQVRKTTSSTITVRVAGFPLFWADVPACPSATTSSVSVLTTGNPAAVAWVNSWGQPHFDISLHNNYKVQPVSIGNTFPFKPVGIQRAVIFTWHATLALKVR